jgi:hypothetical protein
MKNEPSAPLLPGKNVFISNDYSPGKHIKSQLTSSWRPVSRKEFETSVERDAVILMHKYNNYLLKN